MNRDNDPVLTPAETARELRVDPKTLARWVRAGRIEAIRLPSGHRRFRESVVKAILNNTEGGAA